MSKRPRTLTLTVPPAMQEAARLRAANVGLPLSTYVQQLIRRDLGLGSMADDAATPEPIAVNFAQAAPSPSEPPPAAS
jgi:hypothetical protein